MPARSADLRGALVADLPRGRIETREQRRLVALPAEWLEALVQRAPVDAAATLGAQLAVDLERDARAVLDSSESASPEDVAYALSVALATHGMGVVQFERWGDALTLLWREAPGSSHAWQELCASAAASLLGKLLNVQLAAAPLGPDGGELRFLLASPEVCAAARDLARGGARMPEILARLERAPEGA